ncbi:hypothetical protein [Frankia sp. KB5]|uniref:hypothetical protein n=1 Tax=Frankia sp. KB5 TaxID=683318 RepID=UPI000A1174CD|nr:hypothetical protein [Frankia sp. KB5]ORT48496.1 hypothetical protein KBI5_15455 [Frankia sp. KB5]
MGDGNCRLHGGNTPAGQLAGVRERVVDGYRRFGAPRPIAPLAALQEEISRTAGMISMLEGEVNRTVDPDGRPILVDTGGLHPTPSPLVILHREERKHFIAAARAAADAGVEAERQNLIKAYRDHVLDIVDLVVRALGHDPDDPRVAAVVGGCFQQVAAAAERPMVGGEL